MRLALLVLLVLVHSAGLGAAAEVDMTKDSRLAQPVTIQCLNVRLHTALEQISASTKVTIRCGRDAKDWQVRDIPITICARNMRLENLLESIASTTHLLLSQEKVGKLTFYRIWRDRKRQKEMDDFFAAKAAADMDKAAWKWDVAAKLKDVPAEKLPREMMDRGFPLAKSLAALLAALGSEGRDRVMSGSTIRLTMSTAPESTRGLLEALFRNALLADDDPEVNSKELTPEDVQKCAFLIYRDDAAGFPEIWTPILAPPNRDTLCSPNFALRYALTQPHESLPKYPAGPVVPGIQDLKGDLKLLKGQAAWDLPVLQTKISLEAPKDKKDITCGDLLSALSKASGFNTICEDFESHRRFMSPESLFKPDTTIGAVLKGLDRTSAYYFRSGFVWYVDEKDKLILGAADEWPFHHKDLVSDEFLAYLRAKLNGDGVPDDRMDRPIPRPGDPRRLWPAQPQGALAPLRFPGRSGEDAGALGIRPVSRSYGRGGPRRSAAEIPHRGKQAQGAQHVRLSGEDRTPRGSRVIVGDEGNQV
jgi:hypothetical protein